MAIDYVTDILINAFRNKKLAPLYIIRSQTPPLGSQPIDLKDWARDFASLCIEDHFKVDSLRAHQRVELGHSDILFVEKDPDSKSYKHEEQGVIEFYQSHEHPPLELNHKLIFVSEAEKIPVQLANKWLKTLEEPISGATTFLMVDGNTPLLQTIESRAITLRLRRPPEMPLRKLKAGEDFHEFVRDHISELDESTSLNEAEIKDLTLAAQGAKIHLYLQFVRHGHNCETYLYQLLLDFMALSNLSLREANENLHELQWFQKTREYNNAPADRIIGLLQSVTTVNIRA